MKLYYFTKNYVGSGLWRRRNFLWQAAFLWMTFTSAIVQGQQAQDVLTPAWKQLPMTYDTCYISGHNVGVAIPPKDEFFAEVGANGGVMTAAQQAHFETLRTCRIEINFIEGFEEFPEAAVAMRFAADIWETEIVSDIPIRIDARFGTLGPGVLASAGSRNFTDITSYQHSSDDAKNAGYRNGWIPQHAGSMIRMKLQNLRKRNLRLTRVISSLKSY